MTEPKADDAIEFVPEDAPGVTSGEMLRGEAAGELGPPADVEPNEELSPVFRELAAPRLPELPREDRARLLMQSPNRLFLYWSVRSNPYQTLQRALGPAAANYTFVLRLIDLNRESEEIHQIEAEGNWWFSVEPDSEYRAELGFWSPSRPFVRVMFSNTVHTPRRSPSPRVATDADWRVPAKQFAEVLDASGFHRDAFDVAIAGDDAAAAATASQRAFARMSGKPAAEFSGIDAEELRYAMLAIAAGATLEQLRFRVSARLFAILQAIIDSVDRERALAALRSEFEIDEEELLAEEEEFGPAVFGSSLVNFPRRTRLRTRPRELDRLFGPAPLASHSVR